MSAETITGLDQLQALLSGATQALDSDTLQAAAMAAARVLATDIAARIPERTGRLRGALLAHPAPAATGQGAATVEIADSARGGANHDAIYVEYGTSHNPAEPFMRAGFAAAAPQAQAAAIAVVASRLKN